MADNLAVESYFAKAGESLTTAESELINHRYNSCASRSSYACFQAAIAALVQAGIQPPSQSGQLEHDYVQAQFVGYLINRRKQYLGRLRNVLSQNQEFRQIADYKPDFITQSQASRSLSRSREFV